MVRDTLKSLLGGNDDEELTADDEELDVEDIGDGIDNVDDLNKRLISPGYTRLENNRAKIGDDWTKTMFTREWPEQPNPLFLHSVINHPATKNDISIHIEPQESARAIRELKALVRDIDSKRGAEADTFARRERSEELRKAKATLEALRNTQTDLFEVTMYTTVRSDTEDGLDERSKQLSSRLETAPAQTDQVTAIYTQMEGLRSVSPIAKDELVDKYPSIKKRMMGGAVASLLPFTSQTVQEDSGVEFGVQAATQAPVIVDRFDRDNGYNQLTVGKIGAGKSFSTKLNILRTYAAYDDVLVFILDPLEGFTNIVNHLDGNRIMLGAQDLNPLEIRGIAEDVDPSEIRGDPFGQKINGVMDFFASYFHYRGMELGDAHGLLSTVVHKAYELRGITEDPTTHSNQSPTVQDVLAILKEIANNPEEHTMSNSPEEVGRRERQAGYLLTALEPLQEGREMDHLGKETKIDLYQNDVNYLDLSQYEGSGEMGLMMKLLFEQVYQISKETDKRVLFCIDEARYIMRDSHSLEFLEQAVRHSRHYDLSINFITQTADEFFVDERAETIADNCTIRLFHRTPGLSEESADKLDMTRPEAEFARDAFPGSKERGYSEALLGVDGNYLPIQVYARDFESMLVEHGADEIMDAV